MIVVHHLNNSRSQRVLWLLEELGVPFEIQHYQRDAKTMLAPTSLRQVHPLGKSPVITDGAVTVAESGAIIDYLVSKYGNGRLAPAEGTPERLRYTYWLHYAEGSAMPPLLLALIFNFIPRQPMPFFIRPLVRSICGNVRRSFIQPQLDLHLGYMNDELGKSKWFAGDTFSAADIQMSFPLEAAATRGGIDQQYPRLADFLRRIQAMPSYQRALEKGGPYQLMS